VELLFSRGAISQGMLTQIGYYYGLVLVHAPAGALVLLLPKLLIAIRDRRGALIGVLVSSLLPVLFLPYAGRLAGLAGTIWVLNAANWLAVICFAVCLGKKKHAIHLKEFASALVSSIALGAAVAGTALTLTIVFTAALNPSFIRNIAQLGISVLLSGIVCVQVAKWLKIEEVRQITDQIACRLVSWRQVAPSKA
jgi:peptidoglycan biosynthesis protein MviN/MurJ (putative lipid II flippase)